jgi:malonyl-CoA O-methyltransferase
LRLLETGCGTARRLDTAVAASPTGVEPSWGFSAAGAASRLGRPELTVLQGHAGDLPVADTSFDVAWCRLVLGHVAELGPAYAEMARALVPGGTAVVSDFHPEAHAQGHRRTFRSPDGVWEIETYAHALAAHVIAAEDAGLVLVDSAEACVGPVVRHLYAEAGRLGLYKQHLGMPLVFALRFERV